MTPIKILMAGSVLIITAFFTVKKYALLSPDELGAIFTGLGFVGLIATLRHERDQAEYGDKEHRELLAAMKDQVRELSRGTELQVNATLFNAWNLRWAQVRREIDSAIVRRDIAPTEFGNLAWKRAEMYRERVERSSIEQNSET